MENISSGKSLGKAASKEVTRKAAMSPIGLTVIGSILLLMVLFTLVVGIGGQQNALAGCQTPTDSSGNNETGSGTSNTALFQAIQDETAGNPALSLSMLLGSYLESGWDNSASGGGAFGPFQIQEPGVVHPDITTAQAVDPVYATHYMLPAYKAALGTVPASLWKSDPERAAEETAYAAERPRYDYYTGQGEDKVHEAYVAATRMMQQLGIPNDFSNLDVGGTCDTELGGGGDPDAEALANNPNITFTHSGPELSDLRSGRISPRLVALLSMIAAKHKIGIFALASDHNPGTNHEAGRGVDIWMVDGDNCYPPDKSGGCWQLAQELDRIKGCMHSTELIYFFDPGPSPDSFSKDDHDDHIHVGFDGPLGPKHYDTGTPPCSKEAITGTG